MNSSLCRYIDDHSDRLFEILSKIISFNTENDGMRGCETPLSEYMCREYERLNINCAVYSPDEISGIKKHEEYLSGRNLEGRKNFTALLPCTREGSKQLMLAAHLDTVPAGSLSLWSIDPFSGKNDNGKIYGRGACDDKYALAACLFLAEAMCELGLKTKNRVYVSGYVDEEFGGGDGALACCLKYPSDFYLNMDGNSFEIWNTATGGQRIGLYIKHPEPLQCCSKMLDGLCICRKSLESFGEARRLELKNDPRYQGTDIPENAFRILSFDCGTNTNDKNVGHIDFAFYTNKGTDKICAELEACYRRISLELEELNLKIDKIFCRSRFFNFGECSKGSEDVKLLLSAGEEILRRELPVCASPLSDLSIFMKCSGGRAAGFGIGRGFGERGGAHQTDEYVLCSDLIDYTKIIGEFISRWDND